MINIQNYIFITESLKEAIWSDIKIAKNKLDDPVYSLHFSHPFWSINEVEDQA